MISSELVHDFAKPFCVGGVLRPPFAAPVFTAVQHFALQRLGAALASKLGQLPRGALESHVEPLQVSSPHWVVSRSI